MTERTLKTRLLLKQDTLVNWNSSTLPLKKGEIVFATASANIGSGLTEPVVMAKVCTEDGKTFSEIPFSFYAKASDVYDWAKQDGIKFEKVGTGNVVSGFTFADGKIKYETASVATSEGLEELQNKIADNEDMWAANTTYTFGIDSGKLVITPSKGTATTLDLVTPEELTNALKSYVTTTSLNTELAKKQDNLVFNTAYNAANNKVATMADIAALSGAMHFIGVKESVPSSYSGVAGDVILVGNKEYVYDGTAFVELGDESIYAVAGNITDADIAANAAIAKSKLASDVQASLDKADNAVQPAAITNMATTANVATAKSEAISSAAIDATTKANTALADAKKYTDGEVTKVNTTITSTATSTLNSAKSYADGLAANYATSVQGSKADSALQSISAGTGLKVSAKADNSQTINIDDSVTFILDCGGAEG